MTLPRVVETIDENGWTHRRCEGSVPENSKVVGGVLCRYWNEEEPEGVRLINSLDQIATLLARIAELERLAEFRRRRHEDVVRQMSIVVAERDRMKEANQSLRIDSERLMNTASRLEGELAEAIASHQKQNKRVEDFENVFCDEHLDNLPKSCPACELAEARRILGIISKGFHLLAHPSEGKFESCMWETCQEALAICHSTAKEGE